MNKKNILVNTAVLFAALLICFVLVEVFIRWFWLEPVAPYYDYPRGLHIPDDTKGYKYQPGFKGVFSGALYKTIGIRINSRGLRDAEHDYAKNGKYRILGLGDSVTFGTGIRVEQTYLSVLERLMKNNIDEKSDVIKAGFNGYDFDQEYAYYIEEGYKYNPDIVMIGVVLNDASMVNPAALKESTIKKIDDDKTEQKNPSGSGHDIFPCHCRTYQYLKYTLNQLVHYKEIKASRYAYNEQYFALIYYLWDGKPWDNYSKNLLNLNERAKSGKSSVVVVLFPYTQQFKYAENYGRLPQEKITALAAQNGIAVIDLYEILNRRDYQNFYLNGDNVHLNEKGNKLAGEFIYGELLKKGLIKK